MSVASNYQMIVVVGPYSGKHNSVQLMATPDFMFQKHLTSSTLRWCSKNTHKRLGCSAATEMHHYFTNRTEKTVSL